MQVVTGASREQKKKPLDVFSVFLVVAVVVAIVFAAVIYRHAFGAGLSVKPDNWSAFGSYVGGIFGPFISFLTLLAILKTIGLQKELLDTQRTEFEAMQGLQLKSVEAQLSQIKSSALEGARRVIEECRMNTLQVLDTYMRELRSEYESKKSNLHAVHAMCIDGKSNKSAKELALMAKKLDEYERKLASMTILYGEICFGEFDSALSLRKSFHNGITGIWHPTKKESSPPKE